MANLKSINQIKNKEIYDILKKKMGEWAEEARGHAHDVDWWPVKYASVEFDLPEGNFVIYPQNLGEDIDDYMFERVEDQICTTLKKMGARSIYYTGMLD